MDTMTNVLKYHNQKEVFITDIQLLRDMLPDEQEKFTNDLGYDGSQFKTVIVLKDKSSVRSSFTLDELANKMPLVNIGKAKNEARRFVVASNMKPAEKFTKEDKEEGIANGLDLSRTFRSRVNFYYEIPPVLSLRTKDQLDNAHDKSLGLP